MVGSCRNDTNFDPVLRVPIQELVIYKHLQITIHNSHFRSIYEIEHSIRDNHHSKGIGIGHQKLSYSVMVYIYIYIDIKVKGNLVQ